MISWIVLCINFCVKCTTIRVLPFSILFAPSSHLPFNIVLRWNNACKMVFKAKICEKYVVLTMEELNKLLLAYWTFDGLVYVRCRAQTTGHGNLIGGGQAFKGEARGVVEETILLMVQLF